MVLEPTRENIIFDLVIASQDHLTNNVAVGEHLGSCDHKLVLAYINTMMDVLENKTLVPNFRKANVENLRRALSYMKLPETD